MGIIYSLKLASDDDVQLVRAQPEQALYLAMGSSFKPTPEPQKPVGLIGKMLGRKPETAEQPDFPPPARDWPDPDEETELFLDKAWEPINVILTNGEFTSPWPADFLVDENKTVYGGGEGELWDFPILAFDSDDVRQIAAWLESVSREQLSGRFNPDMLAEWDLEWLAAEPTEVESILDDIDGLRAWMRAAAERDSGVVGVVS